jgi:hypothetical protein
VGVAESLRQLDRRVLGVSRYPRRRVRRQLLQDARTGRPLDNELVRQTRAWAEHVLGARHARRRLLGTAGVAVLCIGLVVVTFLSDFPSYSGVGAGVGGVVGNLLGLQLERVEARDVLRDLPGPARSRGEVAACTQPAGRLEP